MKQAITLRVPIHEDWDAGDRVQVFTDFGTGTVNLTKPLLPRPVSVFPGKHRARGLGSQPVGSGRVKDGRASRPHRGIRTTRVGRTPVGNAEPFVALTVNVPAAFGQWKFAVRVVDAFQNVQAGGEQEIEAIVSGTDPMPLRRLDFDSYDGGSDQVTFNLTRNTE